MSEDLLARIRYLEELDRTREERIKDIETGITILTDLYLSKPKDVKVPRRNMIAVRICDELNLEILKLVKNKEYPNKSEFLRAAIINEIKRTKEESPDFWQRIERVERLLGEAEKLVEELKE